MTSSLELRSDAITQIRKKVFDGQGFEIYQCQRITQRQFTGLDKTGAEVIVREAKLVGQFYQVACICGSTSVAASKSQANRWKRRHRHQHRHCTGEPQSILPYFVR